MSIGLTTGFSNITTTSPGKIKISKWQNSIVNWRYPNIKFNGAGIILPGTGEQLDRHRKEHIENGIDEKNQFMLDWDKYVYKSLVDESKKINFTGQIVKGNIVNFCETSWVLGRQIDLIDFGCGGG